MFDNIAQYINNNPIIFILLIIILLLIIFKLYSNSYINEGFNVSNPALNPPTPAPIAVSEGNTCACPVKYITPETPTRPTVMTPTMELVSVAGTGYNRVVRFRTRINGKYYYLMVMPRTSCTNLASSNIINPQSNDAGYDCLYNVIVLVEETSALANVNNYVAQINDNQKVCNFQKALECNRRLSEQTNVPASEQLYCFNPNNVLTETNAPCVQQYPDCRILKQTQIDFLIQKSPYSQNGSQQFLIKGISGQLGIDSSAANFYLNQDASSGKAGDNSFTTTVVCADYAINNTIYTVVDLIPGRAFVSSDVTNMMNGSTSNNDLRVKIRFNLPLMPPQLDINTNKAITRPFYLGACKNNICTLSDGSSLARCCLFNDLLNSNVLDFEPIIIQYS